MPGLSFVVLKSGEISLSVAGLGRISGVVEVCTKIVFFFDLVEQVCLMDGAGMPSGWYWLDFRGQTGANRMRVCGKRGAGM